MGIKCHVGIQPRDDKWSDPNRGSEFFRHKQLFHGYRPMDMSRNSAFLKSMNGQKQVKTVRKQPWQVSKWPHYKEDSIVHSSLSHMSEPMGLKGYRKLEEKSAWPELRPLKIQCGKINGNCALRGSYAYLCNRNRQYEHKRAMNGTERMEQHEILFLGTIQCDWAGVWICVGWKLAGDGAETSDQVVCSNTL